MIIFTGIILSIIFSWLGLLFAGYIVNNFEWIFERLGL